MLSVLALFVALNVAGHLREELDWSNTVGCSVMIVGSFILRHYLGFDPHFLEAGIAVMDICLVLKVFKGDLNLR